MKSINEWMNRQKSTINEANGLFSTQKEVDAAKKKLAELRSVIIAMGAKKSKEWEFNVSDMLYKMAEEWNQMLESYGVYPDLKVMKYQGVLADCLSCLWNSLVTCSVGQPIGPGYRSLASFSKLAKLVYKAYDKVLLVKPINIKK